MSHYLTDDEQLDLIRNWFKKYGKLVISSLIIFLAVFFGAHTWQNYRNTQTENASIFYERLLLNLQEHKKMDYSHKHQNTAYGQLVTLLEAKEAINQGDFATAINNLNWVISHTKSSELKQISRIRLARILLSQNEPELALEQLKIIDNATFTPIINAVKSRETINPSAPLQPIIMLSAH